MQHQIILFACVWCCASAARVAIIGGGIGAASSALHLRDLIEATDLEIHVFEKEKTLGGRVESELIDDQVVELGASILYQGNKLVSRMVKTANYTLIAPGGGGLTALFDGHSLVFSESRWRLFTLFKLLWSYGFQPWYFGRQATTMADKFSQIYVGETAKTAFERPEDMLRALGLYDLTQICFREFIQEKFGGYPEFARDFVSASSKVNYNQDSFHLNALAGLVSLLPATDPRVFRVKEGNARMVEAILAGVEAVVRLTSAVEDVAKLPDGRFQLTLSNACVMPDPFDAVIIAAPLKFSGIKFSGMDMPVIPRQSFQTTVTTVVRGSLRPQFFGLPAGSMLFDSFLVTEVGSKVPFNSISKVGAAKGGNKELWKLFSSAPLPHAWLGMLFDADYEIAVNKTWAAYPAFDPPENFPPFLLHQGLFFASAWESAASAMEMAAIGGKNAALLAAKHLASSKSRQAAAAAVAKVPQGPEFDSSSSSKFAKLDLTAAAGAAATAAE